MKKDDNLIRILTKVIDSVGEESILYYTGKKTNLYSGMVILMAMK